MSTEAEYADLEIRISKDHPDGYKVEIRLDPGMDFSAQGLSPDLLPWVPGDSTAEDGERLFQWIFATDLLKQAWSEARGQRSQRRIRLCIDDEAPELHTIPWELLRDPGYGGQILDLAAATATPFER